MPNNLLTRIDLKQIASKLPDWLVYVGVILLVADEFMRRIFGFGFLDFFNDARITVITIVTSALAISIILKLDRLTKKLEQSKGSLEGIIEVLPSHQHIDFAELIMKSKDVKLLTLSGSRSGLGDARVSDALNNGERRSKVTILLGDPSSAAIKSRYENDEPSTYEAGTVGIDRRLRALYQMLNAMSPKLRNKTDIRVFSSYPTLSIIQADDDLYTTAYGYKLRGTDCPKVHSSKGQEYGTFALKHFDMVYKSATPLEDWITAHQVPN